jgi:flavodoxin
VVFFSLEGNVRLLAESVARATEGTLVELVPSEPRRDAELTEYVWGDTRIVCEARPQLDALQRDPGEFDLIFLGSPVWKGSVAPAVLSFLEQCDFYRKQVALFCAYSGRIGGYFEQAEHLLLGCEIVGTIGFREPLRLSAQKSARDIAVWARGICSSVTV